MKLEFVNGPILPKTGLDYICFLFINNSLFSYSMIDSSLVSEDSIEVSYVPFVPDILENSWSYWIEFNIYTGKSRNLNVVLS
jgi:hypothetical protein